jgi:hypothetical protein
LFGEGKTFDLERSWDLKKFLVKAGKALSIKAERVVQRSNGAVVQKITHLIANGDYVLLQDGEIYDPGILFCFLF